MKLTGAHFIGNTRSKEGTDSFNAVNPENQISLDVSFVEALKTEVDSAVQKAENAFTSYKSRSNEERALFLEQIGEELLELGDSLLQRCNAETALPMARLTGERMRTVNQMRLFAAVIREGSWVDARIDTANPDRSPIPKSDIRQMQIPLGPVGIFGASNFPLAFSVAGGDTASALAAGCPVVVKGHPLHPGTSEMVAAAIITAARKTGMPDGVFSLLQGRSVEVGMAIVAHPLITAIGFTGSFRGGKAIFDAANNRNVPIPVFAEMGSTNPVFILPGALKERRQEIASGLVKSLNLGVGQFCTNPGLLITNQSPNAEDFLDEMVKAANQASPGTMLSEGIKKNYLSGIDRLKSDKSVSSLTISDSSSEGNLAESFIFRTSGKSLLSNPELAEEVFGPSTINVIAEHEDEMIEVAKSLTGHLTATIHGTNEDLQDYQELIEILERKVGRLIFNGYPTGVEVCHSMVHGGPYPATTASQSTSVGTGAIRRFTRPICYQDFPQETLPEELKDGNPLNIWRLVDGNLVKEISG